MAAKNGLHENQALVQQLERQLAPLLDPWVAAYGREESRELVLECLARYYQPLSRAARLEQENRRLQAQVVALSAGVEPLQARSPRVTGLVSRVKREALALGAPLSVDDQCALQSLVLEGSPATAEALGRHLIALAEETGSDPIEIEKRATLDPKRDQDAEGDARTQKAQERLWAASQRGRRS